jgi:hypothetical protein
MWIVLMFLKARFSSLGGPLLNMADYVNHLKGTGVDTEYWRQVGDLLEIYETFIEDYLACYYARTWVKVGVKIGEPSKQNHSKSSLL